MKTYVINLERVPQRAAFMKSEAERIGLKKIHFFPAVDAQMVLKEKISRFYRPKSWKAYWEMTATEVAVFESHRILWEKCAYDGESPFFICEDDVLMSSSLPEQLLSISKQVEKFDIVHIDAPHSVYRFGQPESWAGVTVAPILQPISSAAAYVISPKGAQKLIALSNRGFCDHVDDFLTRPRRGYRAFQSLPAAAIQGMFADAEYVPVEICESERTSNPQTNGKLLKGPIPYRLFKELRRTTRKIVNKTVLNANLKNSGGFVGSVPLAEDLPSYRG